MLKSSGSPSCIPAWCREVPRPPSLPVSPALPQDGFSQSPGKEHISDQLQQKYFSIVEVLYLFNKWESLNSTNPNRLQTLSSLLTDSCWVSISRNEEVRGRALLREGILSLLTGTVQTSRASGSGLEDHGRMIEYASWFRLFSACTYPEVSGTLLPTDALGNPFAFLV